MDFFASFRKYITSFIGERPKLNRSTSNEIKPVKFVSFESSKEMFKPYGRLFLVVLFMTRTHTTIRLHQPQWFWVTNIKSTRFSFMHIDTHAYIHTSRRTWIQVQTFYTHIPFGRSMCCLWHESVRQFNVFVVGQVYLVPVSVTIYRSKRNQNQKETRKKSIFIVVRQM